MHLNQRTARKKVDSRPFGYTQGRQFTVNSQTENEEYTLGTDTFALAVRRGDMRGKKETRRNAIKQRKTEEEKNLTGDAAKSAQELFPNFAFRVSNFVFRAWSDSVREARGRSVRHVPRFLPRV